MSILGDSTVSSIPTREGGGLIISSLRLFSSRCNNVTITIVTSTIEAPILDLFDGLSVHFVSSDHL